MIEEELQTDIELEDVPELVDTEQGPVDDPDLAEFLSEGEADTGEEEFEPVKLTLKQKLIVGATVVVSFIVLSLLYFPYDQIVRNVFMQSFPGSSINSIDLNLFGPDEFKEVRLVQGGGQIVVQAANVNSGLSWTGFLRNQLDGDVNFTNVRLNSPMADLEVSEAEADFDFAGLNLKHRFKRGTIAVVLKNIFLQRVDLEGLVGFPVDIDAEKIVIQEVKLGLRVENGTASVTEGILTSNVFNITASGNIDLDNDTLDFSRPSLNICMRPAENLDQDSLLAQIYTMGGGAMGGKLCFDLKGTFANPTFEREGGFSPFGGPADTQPTNSMQQNEGQNTTPATETAPVDDSENNNET